MRFLSLAVVVVLVWLAMPESMSVFDVVITVLVLMMLFSVYGWWAARRWQNFTTQAASQNLAVAKVLNVKPHGQETEVRLVNLASRQRTTIRVWGRVRAGQFIAYERREVYGRAQRFDRTMHHIFGRFGANAQ